MSRMITQDRLKELLHYDSLTGEFIWVKNASKMGRCRIGDIAGVIAGDGYVSIGILGKRYKAHRLAWLYVTGQWPVDQIDHRDRVRSNNAFTNLREATNKTNSYNHSKNSNNTSGFVGVTYNKRQEVWTAQVKVSGKNIFLGNFKDKDAAVEARSLANMLYGFDENHGKDSK